MVNANNSEIINLLDIMEKFRYFFKGFSVISKNYR